MSDSKQQSTGIASHVGGWLALVSAAITITITVLNTIWSKDAQEKAAALSAQITQQEQSIKAQQLELDAGKEKLARYGFVQTLMAGVIAQDAAQKNLTINLITLALTPDEAQRFFSGLEASKNPATSDVGALGSTTVALANLILQMNDAAKENRLGAVQQLINNYRSNSTAVEQALKLLEPPQLDSLSASGRINVLVFLRNTDNVAWSPETKRRGEKAITNIRARSSIGLEIGNQTEEALSKLSEFIKSLK